MSRHQAELTVNIPQDTALAACRAAAATANWRIATQSATGLVCDELAASGGFTNPVRVEIALRGDAAGATAIVLSGSNLGFGSIQSKHVKSKVEGLSQAIAAAASRPAGDARSATTPARCIIVNGRTLTDEQVAALEGTYRIQLHEGNFWYDRMTGAWGYAGGATAGAIRPGLDLGPLREDCSGGNTGVFINGRHLPVQDVLSLQQIVQVVLPGRYWLDGQGNFGNEGGPPLGNIWLLANSTSAPREGVLSTWDKTGVAVIGGDVLIR